MNINVRTWLGPNNWYHNVNEMFQYSCELDVGYFDIEYQDKQILIKHAPGLDELNTFTFQSVQVSNCRTDIECWIKLIEACEYYIDLMMSGSKDTSKAIIVWRTPPLVEIYQVQDFQAFFMRQGFARFRVIDRESKQNAYPENPFPSKEFK